MTIRIHGRITECYFDGRVVVDGHERSLVRKNDAAFHNKVGSKLRHGSPHLVAFSSLSTFVWQAAPAAWRCSPQMRRASAGANRPVAPPHVIEVGAFLRGS